MWLLAGGIVVMKCEGRPKNLYACSMRRIETLACVTHVLPSASQAGGEPRRRMRFIGNFGAGDRT